MFFFIPVVKTDPQPVFYGWSFCRPSWKIWSPNKKVRARFGSKTFRKTEGLRSNVVILGTSLSSWARGFAWQSCIHALAYTGVGSGLQAGRSLGFFFRAAWKMGDRLKMKKGCFFSNNFRGGFFHRGLFTIQWCCWCRFSCYASFFWGGMKLEFKWHGSNFGRYFRTKKACMMCPGSWFCCHPWLGWKSGSGGCRWSWRNVLRRKL